MLGRKRNDRLSPKEIEKALERIRRAYDDYIISYMAPIDEKSAFEDRYITALHARVDLTRFIKEEIGHLEGLKQKGEIEKAQRLRNPTTAKAKPRSFADRVMEELEKKIAHYPEIHFHDDASPEVMKLYGAMRELDSLHWAVLAGFIRKVHSSTVSYNLENRLLRMTTIGEDNVPPELERYLFLLKQKGRYASELFRESQECIKRAAFFLHDLRIILVECRERGLTDDKDVDEAICYVENLIADFRLKDLKRG